MSCRRDFFQIRESPFDFLRISSTPGTENRSGFSPLCRFSISPPPALCVLERLRACFAQRWALRCHPAETEGRASRWRCDFFLLCPYLEVRGALEGLAADGADVAAVLPVGLSAVAPQRVGVLEHLVAVVALVLVVGPRRAVLPSLVVWSDLERTNESG